MTQRKILKKKHKKGSLQKMTQLSFAIGCIH